MSESSSAGQRQSRNERGQMTVELAVLFPVVLVLAFVVLNAALFISECAVFDRVARDAVRVYATAPAYGEGVSQCCTNVEGAIRQVLESGHAAVEVSCEGASADLMRYTATLVYTPTLFGMGLRSDFLGVHVPALRHSVSYTVDTYKPGVLI